MSDQPTNPLADWLRERDCPCPGCGYNLRNLRAQQCPECARGLLVAELTTIDEDRKANARDLEMGRFAWWLLAGATLLMVLATYFVRASTVDRVLVIAPVIIMNMVMLKYASRRLVEIERQSRRGDARWMSMLVVLSVVSLAAALALGTVRT